ncbi:tyrosinase family protein [Mesorhizobium sp. M0815]|uniref:tyrosinase family protein n=1 Tax=Mesorhizobium sp. M0815 TaxID=2957005 RepID=UPI003339C05E
MKYETRFGMTLLAFLSTNLIQAPFVGHALAQDSGAGPQVKPDIEINNTPSPTDDYLTWAPTPARIRISAPSPQPVTVMLTNDPEQAVPPGRDQPLDGNLAFAERLVRGETATLQTLTLTLPADGSWVPFFVAGDFPRASSADKDAVIEIHLGNASSPTIGSLSTMVRVRKNVDRLTPGERDAFLKAMHDLQVKAKTFESFPEMHDLASRGKFPYQNITLPDGTLNPKFWPDQAHQGSAFLPWHRAFLLLFERRLQAINPAVTIPYWRLNAPTKAFDPMFLGTNRRSVDTFQTEVIFSPANWLYGWSISYKDLKTVIRSPKDTSLLRRGNGATLVGDTELFGATPPYKDADKFGPFTSELEFDPHNRGHALLGAWHANCLISPSDPSFWPFHAEHDRLWAKWQWFYGRFDTEGTTQDSYDFTGKFVPNDTNTTNLGHNLKDMMWPWDGTKGRIMDDVKSRANRPDENPFTAFPAAPTAGLWPASDAKPTPADMIDYLGLSGSRLPHGVAYDDVPYGVQPSSAQSPAMAASASIAALLEETAKDNKAPADRRLTAMASLGASGNMEPETVFLAVASDTASPPEVRQEAATNLIETDPAGGTEAVLGLVEQGGSGTPGMKAAIIETGSLVHHNVKVPAHVAHMVHRLLAETASNTADALAVPAAIALAEMLDPNAQNHLTALLKSANIKGATRAQVIAAMSLAPASTAPTLRDVLEKALQENDTETALATLRALAGDPDSRARRLKLTEQDDNNIDPLINRAAMRSLIHETSDVLPNLLVYLEGVPPTDLRKLEAAGAFRVVIESFKPFSRSQVDDWKTRIQAVIDGAPSDAKELRTALSMDMEVLDEAAN